MKTGYDDFDFKFSAKELADLNKWESGFLDSGFATLFWSVQLKFRERGAYHRRVEMMAFEYDLVLSRQTDGGFLNAVCFYKLFGLREALEQIQEELKDWIPQAHRITLSEKRWKK